VHFKENPGVIEGEMKKPNAASTDNGGYGEEYGTKTAGG